MVITPLANRMETRKVQVTGGSTFTVSIPKTWATENDIEAGAVVEFRPEGNSLLLSPRTSEERTEGSIDITDLHSHQLMSTVVTMYISGFDIINLETARVSADQRRTIRNAVQGLVGLEVIEETSDRVVLQDLLDSSELSIYNAITRMRLVALTMLDDAVSALVEDDDDLGSDVVERDDDVDRLWYMVARVFRSSLRSPAAAATIGIPREICFDYHSSARQLERIADHAAKIATLSLELDSIPEDLAEALVELHADAAGVVEQSMDALFEDDPDRATELANLAREAAHEIDEHSRTTSRLIRDLGPQEAQLLGLIVDSISRSADYGVNIAETALQKAAPRPNP